MTGQAARGSAARIVARAHELGFDAVGFARADEPVAEDHRRYLSFVERGLHGEMEYLARHAETRRRLDGPAILQGARTVVCLARRYDRAAADEATDPPLARLMARYARGRDYHGFLRKRLERLAAFVRALGEGITARALCDTAPVLERAWAARAGLGFVGKNGLLIVPGQGSYCLLGEVVTTLELEDSAFGTPLGERCGSCRACLDACPTGAFDAAYALDPRRCVSYATIESRSAPPPSLERAMAERLFGCDDCQTVCPYNAAPVAGDHGVEPFRPLARWSGARLTDLVSADEAAWAELSRGTPLRRATRAGLARNALLVAAGRTGEDARRALESGLRHDDAMVAELAHRLAGAASPAAIETVERIGDRALELPPRTVHLWLCADEDARDPALCRAYHRLLDEEEQRRQARFHREEDRHRFLVSHALVRCVLSRYAGVAPEAWRFSDNGYGKPEVAAPPGAPQLAFNLSHTKGLSVCAVSRHHDAVGVDVEWVDRRTEAMDIADRFFSSAEVRALRALPEERQRERFFCYWTLKESYIKARGLGLSIPLGHFSFELDQGPRIGIGFDPRLEDDPERWNFALLRPTQGHLLAVAVPGAPLELAWADDLPLRGLLARPGAVGS